jgi:hypothetical protein
MRELDNSIPSLAYVSARTDMSMPYFWYGILVSLSIWWSPILDAG